MSNQVGDFGSNPSSSRRLYYIDNLRILLITLVVVWHAAVTYGAPGTWPYHEGQADTLTTILFTFFYAANGPYVLGFFFLISGYFASGSLERKGVGSFIWDWLKRLGIPLALYILIIDPLIIYGIKLQAGGFQGSFWSYFPTHFEGYRTLGVGPMWFIEGLLIVLIIYSLVWPVFRQRASSRPSRGNKPSNLGIAALALILGVLSFLLRIWIPVGWLLFPLGLPIALFPQFIALFIAGIMARSRNWFEGIPRATGRLWMGIAIFFIVVLFPIVFVLGGALEGDGSQFMGGISWQSFAFAVWEQFVGVGMIIGLLVWFRERFNRQGALAKNMADNAFAVYFIHAPVLVFISLGLSGIQLYPLLKFALVAPLTVVICFFLADLLRRIPGVRGIM